ncbi:MAG: hypothetical protein DI591_06755 [Citromicrobium sp.]|nr:MAG: hypothetical protein DI591_06755 [Citromicrobium sp.]
MRISSLASGAALVSLAGCSDPPMQAPAEPGAQAIACQVGGSDTPQQCFVERRVISDGKILIIRHPDGGFRRFREAADGSGLAALDGADAVRQTFAGGTLEITIAGDSYSLPAGARE